MNNLKKVGFGLVGVSFALLLVLYYVKVHFDAQGLFLCKLVAQTPSLNMNECPAHSSVIPNLLMLAFGLACLVMFAGFYLGFSTQGAKIISKVKQDYSHLDQTEKKIVEMIELAGGSMYQSKIILELGLHKVKVSRILDKLEHDDRILERKRRGMANLVVLK